MRKLGFLIATLLILTGCSFTSTYTINGDGTVTGTSTFGVPKSALPKVTTIDQWKTILDSNNFPAPTDSPSPTPSQSASCAPGEDNVLGQWTYACSVSGDISALNGAISASGSSDMTFAREGRTLTISQPPSSTSSDSDNPFGINGVTLFFITTTLTVPGSVTSVSGNATKVNDNTVKFETDESQTDISTATVTLPEMSTTATSVSLTAKVMNSLPNQSDVSLSASMATPVPGVIEFFDGETSLGKAELGLDGKAEFIAIGQSDGSHSYQAKFLPNNWWS
ncbi:MAG: hypothetical protein EBR84_02080, partial [Actinobacteria bacterium]|nr:hypothetical protein [Actinomycetota bacterium]